MAQFWTHARMVALDDEQRSCYARGGCSAVNEWMDEHEGPAELHLPLGEIMNERIAGHVFAWRMLGKLATAPITGKERFAAQGLEGKVVVATTLVGALLVWRECARGRCTVRA